jgi:hypothetical protein
MDLMDIHFSFTNVPFRGSFVNLTHCDTGDCPHAEIEVIHHYDDEDRHYCPTGFVMCLQCGGVGDEPEPNECHKWGMR